MQKKDKAAPEVSLVFAQAEQGAPFKSASVGLSLSPNLNPNPNDFRSAKRRRVSSSSDNTNAHLSVDKLTLEDGRSLPSVSTLASVAKANGIQLPSESGAVEQPAEERARDNDNTPVLADSDVPLAESPESNHVQVMNGNSDVVKGAETQAREIVAREGTEQDQQEQILKTKSDETSLEDKKE